ncbi:MAG: ribosomal L7Ae/L30e/S12e/Gadd45 family protein [Oscillospiraceae bacterium]|nr:ribosomal L7Ae/L30e/S12e/Gadd45 family protein [Oscillospiraceae bacterium]MBQ9149226.1 ribosomal L7Ae/L30e/S12e/Gadd45 family protein [Oscillospiraceae bacterium]
MLAELARRKVVVGSKQLRKALESGRARLVFLARNADPAITEPLEAMCRRDDVTCVWVQSMLELGQACGIDVGAAAAAAVE